MPGLETDPNCSLYIFGLDRVDGPPTTEAAQLGQARQHPLIVGQLVRDGLDHAITLDASCGLRYSAND